jgi:hypothetical protein
MFEPIFWYPVVRLAGDKTRQYFPYAFAILPLIYQGHPIAHSPRVGDPGVLGGRFFKERWR